METMSLGMDVFAQPSYLPSSSWILQPSRSGCWTLEENKIFERALAIYDKETPDRWQRVAEMIPGKSEEDVRKHYRNLEDDVSHIEAGLVPIPGYSSSSFTVDWGNGQVFDGLTQCNGSKRPGGRASDPERKKGVPWTEEEHRLFLMGLKKYGKGDWRNISRNFVITRTPTQVASHAQKYFIRLGSGGKDKRRSSIHDITTASLGDDQPPSPSQMHMLSVHPSSVVSPERSDQFSVITDSNQSKEAETVFATMASSQLSSSMLMQPSGNGTNSYGVKLEDQDLHSDNLHESTRRHQNILFQMQSAHHHPRG